MDLERLVYIASLAEKYVRGSLTEEERRELDAWRGQSERNSRLFKRLCSEGFVEEWRERELWFDSDKACEDFMKCVVPERRRRVGFWYYAAVMVILLIGGSVFFRQSARQADSGRSEPLGHGCSIARLTLDNGEVIELTGNKRDTLLQAGVQLITTGQSVVYDSARVVAAEGYHQLEVPRKGEFFLVLGDGTRVWLNSETRLRYPVCFNQQERRVEVEGEAYFEVRKDSLRPFRVEIPGRGKIEVTGTAFNVHYYPDEAVALVTLVQGRVNLLAGNAEIGLQPGEQGYISGGSSGKKAVNTALYTAWKDGRFVFREQSLEEIMRTISRWYDVNIEFTDPEVKQVTFSGNLRRYDDFGKVINMLEAVRVAVFEVNGNNIRVGVYKKPADVVNQPAGFRQGAGK